MLHIVFLSILGTLHLSGALTQCGIIEHPFSQKVSLGAAVNLQCLTDVDKGVTVTDWVFGEESISVDRDKYSLREDGTLTIASFDSTYAGLYRCVVTNNGSLCVSKAAKLLYFNAQSTFRVHPLDFVGFIGPAAFNCTYDDSEYSVAPTIEWELNNTKLPEDQPEYYSIFSYRYTSFLQVHELSSLEGQVATVRCVVQSESGNVYSDDAVLNISGSLPVDLQPYFSTVPIPLMHLNKGDIAIAGCSVAPYDSIPLVWAFKNHTEILYTGFNIHLIESVPLSLYGPTNLLVNSSEYDYHNATFLCQLLSDSGKGYLSAPITFFVYDSPVITTGMPSESILTRKSGEVVAFDINVDKNTPAVVKWFFNAASLSSSADRRVEVSNEIDSIEFNAERVWTRDLNASLFINNITCDDRGFYQVEIRNPVEIVLLTYRLIVEGCDLGPPEVIAPNVTESPQIIISPSKSPLKVSVGDHLPLYCTAVKGFPILSVQWYSEGDPVYPIPQAYQQIYLVPTDSPHTTVYTCVGTIHSQGEIVDEIRVNVTVIVEKSCRRLKAPKNGDITITDDGKFAFYACNRGYTMRGSYVSKCKNGKWNSSRPNCRPISQDCRQMCNF